jgi:hypothetical protein
MEAMTNIALNTNTKSGENTLTAQHSDNKPDKHVKGLTI